MNIQDIIGSQCEKCKSEEFYIKAKGPHKGLYCASCGKWITWLNKQDYNAAKVHYPEVGKNE